MKIDLNDPRITAFALGELRGQDAIELARAVRVDVRVRAAVDKVRATSSLLMETLGGGETHLLTVAQRDAVRSAGTMSTITDLASARVPFWKKPAVAGIGVAAVVALTLYLVVGRPAGGGDRGQIADDAKPQWNWANVKMDDLNAPAVVDHSSDGNNGQESESAHAVSAAISDDTASYRKELEKRINQSGLEKARDLPELEGAGWQDIAVGDRLRVPLASGAASWPWLRRYIDVQKALPPRRAVRIEEMVNYFRYKSPHMIEERGLAADMELCITPWNPSTLLLAVHVTALPGILESDVEAASVSLIFSSDHIKQARLLGYSAIQSTVAAGNNKGQPQQGAVMKVSRSRGNYVIYELVPSDEMNMNADVPMVSLSLGGDGNLTNGKISSWIHASSDFRFASTITASGMLLAGTSSIGELDTARLNSLMDILGEQDFRTLDVDRRDALKIIRQASALLDASSHE